MEKDNNKILQDLSRLANSALSTALQAKNDMANMIRHHVESFIKKMNFITKREHDVMKKMVTQNSLDIKTLQQKMGMKASSGRAATTASRMKSTAFSKSSESVIKRPSRSADTGAIKGGDKAPSRRSAAPGGPVTKKRVRPTVSS